MGSKAKKGAAFERTICKQLSRWWTNGERDDIFWRSAGSGARAKVRGRAGKETFGHHGDTTASDPIGQPLIKLFTIEMKRGYSTTTIQDLLDKSANAARQPMEQWIDQAIESQEQAGSHSWLLIVKRDRRDALIVMTRLTYVGLKLKAARISLVSEELSIVVITLETFLEQVSPSKIRKLARQVR